MLLPLTCSLILMVFQLLVFRLSIPSVLKSWIAVGGSSSPTGLVLGAGASGGPLLVSSVSCKICYKLLLDLNPVQLHCIQKFMPSIGLLDWPATGKSLLFMPFGSKSQRSQLEGCSRSALHRRTPDFFWLPISAILFLPLPS